MKNIYILIMAAQLLPAAIFAQNKNPQVKITNGTLEGTETDGVRSFKGIPFAKAPVGDLRWKEPQPAENWSGLRKADHFGANAMQKKIFGDMLFRSSGMSEDCLFLNVWTPAKPSAEKLPVLVYFFGGGFVAGDGSEGRYDGESMAKKGIVTLTVNYRLGIFGFLAHPELTKESPHHASGNYGLMDQTAALKWVQQNIEAFGGDPKRVTIAGESAGSISVFAQMASPLSKNLIAGAIGESGAMISPTAAPITLEQAENKGVAFAQKANAKSLADLRALNANDLLDAASQPGAFSVSAVVDGYFFPKLPVKIFEAGEQAHVPLLAGWNSTEVSYQALLGSDAPTPENYANKLKQLYGDKSEEAMRLYPGKTQAEVIQSATALASARFIVYSTWKWLDVHAKTSGQPTYSYVFSKAKPPMTADFVNATPGLAGGITKNAEPPHVKPAAIAVGAPHAFEIEYAMGNLDKNKVYAWTPEDYKISATMLQYFADFVKTGSPNGTSLPVWGQISKNNDQQMNIGLKTQQQKQNRARYLFLDQIYQ